MELLDDLLEITALSEQEAQAFCYTRNNICLTYFVLYVILPQTFILSPEWG